MDSYLCLVVIPNLRIFLIIAGLFGLILCISCVLSLWEIGLDGVPEEHRRTCFKMRIGLVKGILFSVFILFLSGFFPSKKEMIQLKALNMISELKGVEQIPQKLVDRLNELLDVEEKKNDRR